MCTARERESEEIKGREGARERKQERGRKKKGERKKDRERERRKDTYVTRFSTRTTDNMTRIVLLEMAINSQKKSLSVYVSLRIPYAALNL